MSCPPVKVNGVVQALPRDNFCASNYLSSTLTDGSLLVGSSGNVATPRVISGDVTINNLGVVTLGNSGVAAGSYTLSSITVNSKGLITSASSGSVSSDPDPNERQISNMWSFAQRISSVTTQPRGIAYHRKHIWSGGADSFHKWLANDMTSAAATFAFRVDAVEPDGDFIWTTDYASGTLRQINAETNAITNTYTLTDDSFRLLRRTPEGLWRGRLTGTTTSLDRIDVSDGSVTSFTLSGQPGDLTYDGTDVWCSITGTGNIERRNASTGALVSVYAVGGTNNNPMAYDGTNVWVGDTTGGNVRRVNSAGTVVGTHAVNSPSDLIFTGTFMFVANVGATSVQRLSMAGAVLATFTVGNAPEFFAWDGHSLYVAERNDATLVKIPYALK